MKKTILTLKIVIVLMAIFTRAYSQAPLAWNKYINQEDINDDVGPHYPNDICYSPDGSIYITGTVLYWHNDFENNVSLLKLDSSGSVIGSAFIKGYYNNGFYGIPDAGLRVAADHNNNVYLLEAHTKTNFQKVFMLRKYNSSLTEQWKNSLVNLNPEDQVDLQVDNNNCAYIFAHSTSSGLNRIAVYKYNTSGTKLWSQLLPYISGTFAATLDDNRNVYIAYTTSSTSKGKQINVRKYYPSGSLSWQRTYNLTNSAFDDEPLDIKYNSSSGALFVVGYGDNGTDKKIIVLRYSAGGTLQWVRSYGQWGDAGAKSGVDAASNIYIATNNRDYIKYDADGNLIWSRSEMNINTKVMKVSSAGSLYTALLAKSPFGCDFWDCDFLTKAVLKYDSSGILQWSDTAFNEAASPGDVLPSPSALAINEINSEVTVTSKFFCYDCLQYFHTYAWTARRYAPTARLSNPNATEMKEENNSLKIFPNPTANEFTFSFTSQQQENYLIAICDLTGREIYKEEIFAEEGLNEKMIDMRKYENGVYLLTLKSLGGAQMIKVIKE